MQFESNRQFRLEGKSLWALTSESIASLGYDEKDSGTDAWSSEIKYLKEQTSE